MTVNLNRPLSRCLLTGAMLIAGTIGWLVSPRLAHASLTSSSLGASGAMKHHDSCLYGAWKVTNYTDFLSSLYGSHFTVKGVSGTQGIRFSKNGESIVVANHFTISLIANDTHLLWEVSLTGAGNATWQTPSRGTVKFSNIEGDYKETISIGGKTGTATPSGAFGNGMQRYICGKTTLRMFPSPSHPAVVYRRMS